MKPGIIYTRVSTDEQNKGNSPTDQLKVCHAYAQQNEIDVPEDRSFHEDYTGFEYSRPEIDKIRAILEKNRGMALIVRSGDRLARSALVALMIAGDMVKYGVELHFVSRGRVDIRTPEGQFIFQMEAAGNEYWGAKAKEAMSNGRRAQAEAGIATGQGPAPYGYRKEGKQRETRVLLYEPEARIVRLIFEWYVKEELGPVEIARRLNAMGEATPALSRDNNYGYVKYGKWTPGIVNRLMRNEEYLGTLYFYKTARNPKYKPKDKRTPAMEEADPEITKREIRLEREDWLPVAAEPIITPELFAQARKRAEGRKAIERGRPSKYLYLMARRLTCGCCNRKMTAATNIRGGIPYHYYCCNSNNGGMRELVTDKCTLPYFKVDEVDHAIWEWIDELYRDPDKLRERLKEAQKQSMQGNAGVHDEIAALERQKKTLERQLEDMIADQYRVGKGRSKAIFAKLIADTEESLAEAESRLMALRQRVDPLSITDEYIETLVNEARQMQAMRERIPELPFYLVQGDEPVIGLPPLNREIPETYHQAQKEVEKLRLTGTLAIEGDEKVLWLHWHNNRIRLTINGSGSLQPGLISDKSRSKNVAENERGSLQTQSWEDRETGQRRFKTVVRAEDVLFLDVRSEAQEQPAPAVEETEDVPF